MDTFYALREQPNSPSLIFTAVTTDGTDKSFQSFRLRFRSLRFTRCSVVEPRRYVLTKRVTELAVAEVVVVNDD